MAFLRQLSVKGLFGLYDHTINLRKDPPVTIVAGPNGIGKTTLLALVHALLHGTYGVLTRHEFETLVITSENGDVLAARRLGETDIELSLRPRVGQRRNVTIEARPPESALVFSTVGGITEPSTGIYYANEAFRTLGPTAEWRPEPAASPDWFVASDWATDFIETKRLDSLLVREPPRQNVVLMGAQERARAPIHAYLDAVRDEIERTRFESTRIAQSSDRSFARRLLDKASRLTVKEELVRARYSRVESQADELARNGLLADSLDILPTGRLNPTEKRILKLFLDDFESKMVPLQPLSQRLNMLRSIVDEKFINKHLRIDPRQGVTFESETDGRVIDADSLSSGEQHEIALMSRLLFRVPAKTTVLIDEPELSLHVSWQHRMLDDLSNIAEVVGLRFVLATHSTAIINGRWELVEELGPIDDM